MPKPVVPKIGQGGGDDTPPPSDAPTYVVVGVSVVAAITAGLAAGPGAGLVVGILALALLGGGYTVLARLRGWPPLRWDAIPFIIP